MRLLEPRKATTEVVLIMLEPFGIWGMEYLVRANIWRMLDLKVDSTMSGKMLEHIHERIRSV